MKRSFATQAWVLWLVVIALITLLTSNPFYLLIMLLAARIVQATCVVPATGLRLNFWRLALIILMASVLFNMLLVHIGQTVLFTLPDTWWVIGGPITLEAAFYGFINGLTLITLLAIFLAFNAVVPVSELIRLTPRAMANIGMVVMIAVTYVPETLSQLQRIREAQAIRGHRLRGLRDWQPVVIPLLVGGLERAMSLAETMVSRGYGATADVRHPIRLQTALLVGLLLTFGGWLLTFWIDRIGWILMLIGIVLVVGLILWLGRQVAHTRYRRRSWNLWDWTLAISAIVPLLLVFLPIPIVDRSTLFYTPYPQFNLPPFDVWLGLGLTSLATPAILVEL